ncbi:CBS domain-containing protein [Nonomuraea sp. NPDC050680]|uniref:CBS domain-containing protein n=1 Tax=Nonomuraea sp. NPDC050680 TaxID=3154630 RepID=UPI0033C3A718
MSINVRDVTGHAAIAVLEEASIAEIVDAMNHFAVGAVALIDVVGHPVGIVSEYDLLVMEADPEWRGHAGKARSRQPSLRPDS